MIRLAALSISGFGLGLGLAILSDVPAWAQAQDPCVADPLCRDHEDRGIAASAQKDYAEALVEFQAAYARAPIPRLLINIGRSLFRLGQPAEALKYYERFFRAEPNPAPEVAQRVQRYAEEAKAAAAATTSKPPVAEAPAHREVPPAVPTPPAERQQAISQPSVTSIEVKEPITNRRATTNFPAGAGILLGLGTASLAVGIGLGARALSLTGEVVSGSGPFDEGLYSQGMALNQAAIALDVIGGAALAAGGIWTIAWIRRKRQPERAYIHSSNSGIASLHGGS